MSNIKLVPIIERTCKKLKNLVTDASKKRGYYCFRVTISQHIPKVVGVDDEFTITADVHEPDSLDNPDCYFESSDNEIFLERVFYDAEGIFDEINFSKGFVEDLKIVSEYLKSQLKSLKLHHINITYTDNNNISVESTPYKNESNKTEDKMSITINQIKVDEEYEKQVIKKVYDCYNKLMDLIKTRGVYDALTAIEDSQVLEHIQFNINGQDVRNLRAKVTKEQFNKLKRIQLKITTLHGLGYLISNPDDIEAIFYHNYVKRAENNLAMDGAMGVRLDNLNEEVDKFLSAKF